MAAQHSGRRQALHIPAGHQRIRACTGELCAIGTPGHVVERDRVALHDTRTLPMLHVPHPQGVIITSAEQASAVRREDTIVHHVSMPVQHRPTACSLDVSEPNGVVTAATRQQKPIRTPGAELLVRLFAVFS